MRTRAFFLSFVFGFILSTSIILAGPSSSTFRTGNFKSNFKPKSGQTLILDAPLMSGFFTRMIVTVDDLTPVHDRWNIGSGIKPLHFFAMTNRPYTEEWEPQGYSFRPIKGSAELQFTCVLVRPGHIGFLTLELVFEADQVTKGEISVQRGTLQHGSLPIMQISAAVSITETRSIRLGVPDATGSVRAMNAANANSPTIPTPLFEKTHFAILRSSDLKSSSAIEKLLQGRYPTQSNIMANLMADRLSKASKVFLYSQLGSTGEPQYLKLEIEAQPGSAKTSEFGYIDSQNPTVITHLPLKHTDADLVQALMKACQAATP